MVKKVAIPILLLLFVISTAFHQQNEDEMNPIISSESKPIVLLELFTSQGCSSCPPADILLDEVKRKFPHEVFALSYHVDYWNYIGWKDPFSQSKFSTKQRFYNSKLKSRGNYTPQIVVNGNKHFVGSNRTKMYQTIELLRGEIPQNTIQLTNLNRTNDKIHFEYSVKGDLTKKQLRAVLVLDERTTAISRGENRNRTLKNSNIVVAEEYLSITKEHSKGFIEIPALVTKDDRLTLMLIVETDDLNTTGAIKQALL